jgi:hypothetical protein
MLAIECQDNEKKQEVGKITPPSNTSRVEG